MLGYVTCETAELKVKEYELYSAYYCGVCKSIGARYGQLARTVLSYDSVFLAMLLDGVSGNVPQITEGSCLLHPVKGKNIAAGRGIDYAADVMLILAWFNFLDDVKDGEGKKAVAGKAAGALLKRTYSELEEKYPELCSDIGARLDELDRLEKEKCASLDEVAESFAQIMTAIFRTGYSETAAGSSENEEAGSAVSGLLSDLGYHLGKWIYLMDAWEDLEKDIESGAYNPLIYRFGFEKQETIENFRERIKETVEFNLMMYLAAMSRSESELELKGNKGIIENILGMGLLRRTEQALGLTAPEPENDQDRKENTNERSV